jgi:hypothetical protein
VFGTDDNCSAHFNNDCTHRHDNSDCALCVRSCTCNPHLHCLGHCADSVSSTRAVVSSTRAVTVDIS